MNVLNQHTRKYKQQANKANLTTLNFRGQKTRGMLSPFFFVFKVVDVGLKKGFSVFFEALPQI